MVAAGVLPMSHATDGGGSIRIPAGFNGNIGLKPSRGVFSIGPNLSDITGYVSIPGLPQPHGARHGRLRRRLPGRCARRVHTVLVRTRTLHPAHPEETRAGCASRSRMVGRLPRHARDRGGAGEGGTLPRRPGPPCRMGAAAGRPLHEPSAPRRPATSATSRRSSTACWPRPGWSARPQELIEPINIRIWEAGKTSYAERYKMQAVFNSTARLRHLLRGLGHHPRPSPRCPRRASAPPST